MPDLTLTPAQTAICLQVLNVYETGSVQGRYEAISIFHDGPGKIRQITYGAKQTTEYGNLRQLIAMYVAAPGALAPQLQPYVARIGKVALTDDAAFKALLVQAGRDDPVMRTVQDQFFDQVYFQPAIEWAGSHGFTRALSALVIFDSFIHSGSIRSQLRNLFPEKTPVDGGREEVWIRQYTEARHQWLSTNANLELRPTAYRTRDLLREITAGNWDLAHLPFMAHGTPVNSPPAATLAPQPVWSEAEPPIASLMAAPTSAAGLASRILDTAAITLATVHASGKLDDATARQNIIDMAQGRPAHRSSYNTAPGGTVFLSAALLQGMVELAKTFRFNVSEFCGGEHSAHSLHYAGVAGDVNQIDGVQVSASHPRQIEFRQRCAALGATEIKGPGDANHNTHVHAAWPRP